MSIPTSIYSQFVPNIIQIDSLGIGLSYSNVNNLDLTNDEYLVIGERANPTNNTLDCKYNLIVNSEGIAVNTSRRIFNSLSSSNNINSNIYNNAGIYCTNNIVTEGNLIARGLQLEGVTLSDEINSNMLNDLILKINSRDPLLYRGYNDTMSNNIGIEISRDNVYTPYYLTIGTLYDTYSNSHPLNITETANNSIDNIHIAMQNDINNDFAYSEKSKFRLGMIGGSPFSPSIISTTQGMPLEFHVSKSTPQIDILYIDGSGFPDYSQPSNLLPNMVIDSRGNIGIGITNTEYINYNKYKNHNNLYILKDEIEEFANFQVNGSSFFKHIIMYDYYTSSNLHLDDIYIRRGGLTLNANQINAGTFNKGIFKFNSNLYIGSSNDTYTLEVNNTLNVSGNITVNELSTLNNLYVNGISDFNNNVRFEQDVIINNDLYLSNCMHITNGDIFYDGKRLNINDLQPVFINIPKLDIYIPDILNYFPNNYNSELAINISKYIIDYVNQSNTVNITNDIKLFIYNITNYYLTSNISNLIYTSIFHGINSNYINDIYNYITNDSISNMIMTNSNLYIKKYIDSDNSIYNTTIIPNILSNISLQSNIYNYINHYTLNYDYTNDLLINLTNNIQYNNFYFTSNYIYSYCNIISNINVYITSNAISSNYINNIINDIYTSNTIYYPQFITYFNGDHSNVSSNIYEYIESYDIINLIDEYNSFVENTLPSNLIITDYLFNIYQSNIILNPLYLQYNSISNIYSNIISYKSSNINNDIYNYIHNISYVNSNVIANILVDIYASNDIYNIARFIPNNIYTDISNIILYEINDLSSIINNIDNYLIQDLGITHYTPNDVIYEAYTSNTFIFSNLLSIFPYDLSSNVSEYIINTYNNTDISNINVNINNYNLLTTQLSTDQFNNILMNTIFDIYVKNNNPSINDVDLSVLHGLNLTNSNIVYFANNNTLNISGSNLAIPGRLGVGILDTDCYDQQFVVNKRIETSFEIMLQDFSKGTPDSSKVYIGHTKGFINDYNGIINQVDDNSLVIFTQRTVQNHNIYFYAGKDINRTFGIQKQIPTLAIVQNNRIGINTSKPSKELDVIGDIICNDIYIRKSNNITYKTANFVYNNNNLNKFIYIYDPYIKNVCINFHDSTNISLKGLNVSGGIHSIKDGGYYENNIKLGTFKYHEHDSVHINQNVSIGWEGEINNKVPLQIRNLSIEPNNYSVIRLYRGQRGGGFHNDSLYTGIDFCEYEPVLPFQDKDNFRWFIYKYNIDNPQLNRVGPLQIGYVDNAYQPYNFGLNMYYNKNGSYHLDINNKKVDYNYDIDTAMSIHGNLNVYGNINIIDNSNLGFNYKINGIAVSSNIATTLLNTNLLNPTYDNLQLSKDDIAINGEKIILLPNKVTAVGYVDNWFLQYIQRIETDTNKRTPFIVYQKNVNKPICKFQSIDSETPNTASIELGIFYTKKNYNGEDKNKAEFKVFGYNDTTILEINSFSTFNQSLRNFITFYNNGSKNYTNVGSYTCFDPVNGTPITENTCFHIDDDATYLLHLTNHSKSPCINLHRKGTSINKYWLINGPDNDDSFNLTYGESSPSLYYPISPTKILTLTKNGMIGINKNSPTETIDISSAYNIPSARLTNNYMSTELFQKTSEITITNSNLKIVYDIPFVYSSSNNTYYSGFDYTLDTSNLPNLDNSNITVFNYFIIDSTLIFSNSVPATTYHEVNALLYHSNLYINQSNISLLTCNYITTDITTINNCSFDFTKEITILPNLKKYNDFDLFVPDIFLHKNSYYDLNNINQIYITHDYKLTYNYSNLYTLPNILAPNLDDITNTFETTCNIVINSNISNIFVYNTISTLIPLSCNLIYTNYKSLLDYNTYIIDDFSNHIYTSNFIWYNDIASFNLGVATNREKIYSINSTIKVPNTLVGSPIHSLPSPIISGCNINIISTIDFLNITPNAPLPIDFTSYINRKIINTSNIIDNFEIYNIPQHTNVIIEDAYYLYNFNDYIRDLYLNIECIQYLPHITLQNYIKFDDNSSYPIDNTHKIFSYDGNFDLYLDSEGNSDKLLTINKNGDTNIKGNISANDIIIHGHVYDSLGNDLIQHINSDVYKINTLNYEISASNIIFNPIGSYGILINGQERNYTNNIFQINSGKKDNDANFITLYSYTNGSYIHFTSHTQKSYNDYDDTMFRLGMFNNTFGIWKYNLDDVRTLPGGYIDGKPSSMINYSSALTINWNKNNNVFDFDFNGSINLDETSNSYLKLGNTLLQNNKIKQVDNSTNLISFINYLDTEILTITSNNVGINNISPHNDYKLHIGGNLKVDENIRVDGNIITASDKRYKTDIQKIENALDKINTLTGVTYNNILQNNKKQTGLIAQDVYNILPEAVDIDDNGYMSLAYGNMIGIIVESIKELKLEIDNIKHKLYYN